MIQSKPSEKGEIITYLSRMGDVLDPVLDACHINPHAILIAGIEIIIDGNIADTVFRECDVGVQASHSRVSAKSGKVFGDTNCHIAGFNFIQHFLKTRAVKS